MSLNRYLDFFVDNAADGTTLASRCKDSEVMLGRISFVSKVLVECS